VWALAERQHWVVTRAQLLGLGVHPQAIKHRVATGRLHPVASGVYAVGRPQLTREGRWMAAVLSCGPGAVLSHGSAAALWEIGRERTGRIEVSVRSPSPRRRPGVVVHRRAALSYGEVATRDGIPVTSPIRTLVDVAPRLGPRRLEGAINEADKLGLTDPEEVRARIPELRGQRGVAIVRAVVDRHTFVLTDSELERRFLPLTRRAGLPPPLTQQTVNGFRVDFYWPELGLVVETDGLRYHRTPAQQAADRARDQAHAAAGLTTLRFTHAQVRYEPERVIRTLRAVARRLASPETTAE
jgi:hypothetical protein